MESLLSLNGVAQALNLLSLPALIGALALAAAVLTGVAERIVTFIEDTPFRLPRRRSRGAGRKDPSC